jgi:hypothetical protein
MQAFSELVRRVSTFFLAVFLWLHALFLWSADSTSISKHIQFLHLTTTEAILFALLVIFTCASGSGFWKPFRSLAYIYFFPFVVLAFALYWFFLVLRALHRWFKAQTSIGPPSDKLIEQESSQLVPSTEANQDNKVGIKKRVLELLQFLLRPFRRFMLLWCILLLVTTHKSVLWLCLVVVLIQLIRKVFFILQITLFSGPFLAKLAANLLNILDKPLAALAAVTSDAPTRDLKSLWDQLNVLRKVLNFLKEPYLLSRWAWVVGIIFVGSIYVYFSVLFSFAYYRIARVNSVKYSWTDALVLRCLSPSHTQICRG